MTDDAIAGIFDSITPEDFHRDTSALRSIDLPTTPVRASGAALFKKWLVSMVQLCVDDASADKFINFSVLQRPEQTRIFRPDEDETPSMYAARLTREAEEMGAKWFFCAVIAPGRTFVNRPDDELDHNPTPEQIDAAIDDGRLTLGICWLAIRHDDEGADQCAGMIQLDDQAKPGQKIEGELDETNVYYHVLGDAHAE